MLLGNTDGEHILKSDELCTQSWAALSGCQGTWSLLVLTLVPVLGRPWWHASGLGAWPVDVSGVRWLL